MAVTIKDIARIAGVSIGTVSNYINGTKPVNNDTAERIRQAIEETSYEPNYLAKNLRTQRPHDIGVLLPSFDNPYYVKVFEGIESVIRETPYTVNLALTYNRRDYEKQCVENLLRKQINGLILITSMPDDWEFYYQSFTTNNKPLILLDRTIESLEAGYITFNYEEVFFRLTSKLLQAGKRRIFLMLESSGFECEAECLKGFQAAHEAHQIEWEPECVITHVNSKEDAFRATVNLLEQEMPDAVMTTSENKAVGIMESLLFLGYSKDDMPIVTLGEDHWNERTHSVATISTRRPAHEMGVTAARNLLDLIRHPINDNMQVVLQDRITDAAVSIKKTIKQRQETAAEKLRVLMLETPQTHALMSMMRNFKVSTGIDAEIEIVDHQHLLGRIQQDQSSFTQNVSSDVFMFDIPWLQSLVQNGLVADISDITNRSDAYDSLFFPDTAQYFGQLEGGVFGLPFMHALQILYYRKDLFENPELQSAFKKKYRSPLKPPETWKEFNTITKFFSEDTDAIDYGISVPGAYAECLSPELFLRFYSLNNHIFSKKRSVRFENTKTLRVYTQYMQSLQYSKPDWKKSNDEDVVRDFLNGETAMLVSYPSFLNEIILKDEYQVSQELIGFSQTPMKTPILGGWGLGLSPHTTKKEAGYAFLEWACMDTISNYFALMGGFTAVEKTFTNDELIKTYPWFSSYHESNKLAKPIISPKNHADQVIPQSVIDEVIYSWFCKMADKKISIPEAIRRTQEALEKLFS